MTKINEIFVFDSEEIRWTLDESFVEETSGLVDGVYIIGRAVGPFFLIDGESRNRKFYSKKLWENAISKNQVSMAERSVLGSIGHDVKLDDQALREGLVSHIVTKLWIDEVAKVGMGEILILGTKVGRELNTLLRSKIKLAVSSRASGEVSGRTSGGGEIVNPDTYVLEGFDFVRTPGVPIAYPKIVESHTSELPTKAITEENKMALEQLVESLSSEKVQLTAQLDEALKATSAEKVKATAAQQSLDLKIKEVDGLNESLKTTKSLNEELQAKIKAYESLGTPEQITSSTKNLKEIVESYKELGSAEEISEAFDESTKLLAKFSELGSPEKVGEVFDLVEDYLTLGKPENISESLTKLNLYEALATVDEVNKLIDVVENYSKLATPAEVEKLLDIVENYSELATPHQIDRLIQIVEAYTELGTPEQIDSALTKAQNFFESASNTKNVKLAESFASKYDLDKSDAKELIEKFGGIEGAEEFLLKFRNKNDVRSRYRVPTNEGLTDNKNQPPQGSKTLASSLMKNFIR